MGQKVNPHCMRLGINKDWSSKWYAQGAQYAINLQADIKVRRFLMKELKGASVSHITIERPARTVKVTIHSARPGVIIGKKGNEIDVLKHKLSVMVKSPVHISIEEVRKPEMTAKLVAENVAQQLERRVMFRRAIKRTIQTTMRAGAKGVKVSLSGRLGGAEIARTEWAKEGRIPLHTFRADIDYATAEALTTYGIIGVKIWIFKGEIHEAKAVNEVTEEELIEE